MIILIADEHQTFGPPMIIILINPLSSNLMRGYDLVIIIISSLYEFNNLKDLIYELKKKIN